MKHVGKNIKLLRQLNGWNQEHVAAQLNISIPAFSKIEASITDINLTRLDELANVFNVTPIDLISEPGECINKPYEDEIYRCRTILAEKEVEISLLQRKLIEVLDELRHLNHFRKIDSDG